MRFSILHSEVILVSENQQMVKWILEALKSSGLDNELIWLKEAERTRDYLKSEGLYTGKAPSSRPKVFILDETFKDREEVKSLIDEKMQGQHHLILSFEQAKTYLEEALNKKPEGNLFKKKSRINTFLSLSLM